MSDTASQSAYAPLRTAIVGCGRIAGGFDEGRKGKEVLTHAGAYTRHPAFALVACVEPEAGRRVAFMKAWSVPTGFASLEECLANGIEIDVASVCTPTSHHAADLRLLLDSPVRAVFCEKPVCDDVAVTAKFVESFTRAGKVLAVAHSRRWDERLARLQHDLADGRWGPVRAVVGIYNKGVLNNGSHMVDLVQFLIGPLTLKAVTGSRFDHDRDDPTVEAVLSTPQGVNVHLVGVDSRDYSVFELQIFAAQGAIGIEQSGFTLRLRRAGPSPLYPGYRALDQGIWEPTGLDTALYRAVDNIHAALCNNASLASDGASALSAQRLCEDMRRQALEGHG
jgi:predicted dehydrogenase